MGRDEASRSKSFVEFMPVLGMSEQKEKLLRTFFFYLKKWDERTEEMYFNEGHKLEFVEANAL